MEQGFTGCVGTRDEGETEGGGLRAEVLDVLGVEGAEEGFEAGAVDGGGDGEQELVASVGGGVGGEFETVAVEGDLRGVGFDEVRDGQLVKRGQVGPDFFPAAAGEERYPNLC